MINAEGKADDNPSVRRPHRHACQNSAASLLAAITAHAALGGVPLTYLRLGIEHILFGFDHLLFILALVILVRDWRRVALTVTAFAVAHSMTLAAATLGLVSVRGPLVEAGSRSASCSWPSRS